MPAAHSYRAAMSVEALQELISSLEQRGYQVIGPVLRDGAIVYDTVTRCEDLPAGWTDRQEAGRYRLRRRSDTALFAYGVGPQSWKKFLHPAEVRLFAAEREGTRFRILDDGEHPPRYAFLGVRACELAAIQAQDRVLTGQPFADPVYQKRRQGTFLIAVNCTQAAATCFCASLQTGPRVHEGFDLALTEILEDGRPAFLVETGSPDGEDVLRTIETRKAPASLCRQADDAVERAGASQVRHLETKGLREALQANFEHPRWDHAAARCLTCGNCTMVCPTCFCTNVEDASDVGGSRAERRRKWDSCFSQAFSYIHGGSVRPSVKSRFRQWVTHKLAYWVDQFGSLGCVGCGRCITWCPAGIDITEEVHAIRNGSIPKTVIREEDDGNT
jgi:sulfhydrogenase subunit beta (sulfur reductase)